jgi:hypothetical protein
VTLEKVPEDARKKGEDDLKQFEQQNQARNLRHNIVIGIFVTGAILIVISTITLLVSFYAPQFYAQQEPCDLGKSVVVGQIAGFEGQNTKSVKIRNNGNIVLTPVTYAAEITTTTTVSASTIEEASSVPYELSSDRTKQFSLLYPLYPGGCPRQDTVVKLLDDTHFGAVDFQAASLTGSFQVSMPFSRLQFTSFSAQTTNGNVLFQQVNMLGPVKLSTSTGQVFVASSQLSQLQILTSSGNAVLDALVATSLSVQVNTGNIAISSLGFQDSAGCGGVLQASTGSITVNSLLFPPTGSCKLEIQVQTGDIEVILGLGYTGSLQVKSSAGYAFFNGHQCNMNMCTNFYTSALNPTSRHALILTTTSGNATLTIPAE